MKFRAKLTAYGYTAETVSVSLRGKIKKYNNLEAAIVESEAELAEEKGQRKRKQLESQIAGAKAKLEELDAEIDKGIERYKKNEGTYKKAGQQLNGTGTTADNNGTDAGAGQGGDSTTGTDTGANDNTGTDNTNTDNNGTGTDVDPGTGTDTGANDDAGTGADPKPKEKKGNTVGWVIGGIAAAALAVIGINIYKNSQ
jgi:peptidoglycan DL-endopeptidase RipA